MVTRITKKDMENAVMPLIMALNGSRVRNATRDIYGPNGIYSWDGSVGAIVYNCDRSVQQVMTLGTDRAAFDKVVAIKKYLRELGYNL